MKIEAGGAVDAEFKGQATTNVTFTAPGDYLLHLNVDDFSGRGSGETGCCWTTAIVKVTVTPVGQTGPTGQGQANGPTGRT